MEHQAEETKQMGIDVKSLSQDFTGLKIQLNDVKSSVNNLERSP